MDFISVFLVAIALAVDAFSVAVATGVMLRKVDTRQTFRLAWHFGLFQAGMTLIGWTLGTAIRPFVMNIAPWVAFALLLFVGGRMIYDVLTRKEENEACKDPTRGGTMVFLSVATSIDALAVGLGFSLLEVDAWFPALVIGVVALVLTASGLHLGRLLGSAKRIGPVAEIVGGVVLIGIGFNILREHGILF